MSGSDKFTNNSPFHFSAFHSFFIVLLHSYRRYQVCSSAVCCVTGAIINECGLYCPTCNTSFFRGGGGGGGGGGGFRLLFPRQHRSSQTSTHILYVLLGTKWSLVPITVGSGYMVFGYMVFAFRPFGQFLGGPGRNYLSLSKFFR